MLVVGSIDVILAFRCDSMEVVDSKDTLLSGFSGECRNVSKSTFQNQDELYICAAVRDGKSRNSTENYEGNDGEVNRGGKIYRVSPCSCQTETYSILCFS